MPRKSSKDPNRPRGRMTAYAYFLQMCREEHRRQFPNEQVNFQEFSAKCADRWRNMKDVEKKRFLEMAARDKQRYDKEMASYKPPAGFKKHKRAKKDPSAPKRALSAFLYFSQDERPKVKAQHTDWAVAEVAKELGKRWAAAPQKVKDKYEKMASRDKERYTRESTAWKAGTKKGGGGGGMNVSIKIDGGTSSLGNSTKLVPAAVAATTASMVAPTQA